MKPSWCLTVLAAAGLLAACSGMSQPTGIAATLPPSIETEVPLPFDTVAGDASAVASGATTFAFVPEESEVRFLIGEVLAGSATTVVGRTSAVSGEVVVDLSDPASASLATVQVDLSTLATDNSFRNRAIHSTILETGRDEYRFATFADASIEGVPAEVVVGETYTVEVTGELTIHGVRRQMAFPAEITLVSGSRLEGHAAFTFLYSDFGVSVLRLPPQVASVEEEVTLEIDLVAIAS